MKRLETLFYKQPVFFSFYFIFGVGCVLESFYALVFEGRTFLEFVIYLIFELVLLAVILVLTVKLVGEWKKPTSDSSAPPEREN